MARDFVIEEDFNEDCITPVSRESSKELPLGYNFSSASKFKPAVIKIEHIGDIHQGVTELPELPDFSKSNNSPPSSNFNQLPTFRKDSV